MMVSSFVGKRYKGFSDTSSIIAVPEMEDGLMDDTEINHNLEITKKSRSSLAIAPPTTVKYQCALCEERYQTLAAYQKHHKVTHRNCQFLYYTPGQ